MQELVQCLRSLQSKLDRHRKEAIKETPTRRIFIDPVLEALGWDVCDMDEVELEYPIVAGKSVDYALKLNRKVVLLIEAKALRDPLDVKAIAQIIGYAATSGIVWCILTNGVCWKVYRSIEECEAPDKLMFEVSLDPRENEGVPVDQVAERLRRFSRDEMAKGTLDAIGEQVFTDGKVRKALDRLMRNPPRKFTNLLREIAADRTLRSQQIGESLKRLCPRFVAGLGETFPSLARPDDRIPQVVGSEAKARWRSEVARKAVQTRRSVKREEHHTSGIPREVLELYQSIDRFCLQIAPAGEVSKHYLAGYIAYLRRERTFCSLRLFKSKVLVWLPLKYSRIPEAPSFARDVSSVRHKGRGDTELAVSSPQHVEAALPLIRLAFEQTC